MLYIVFMNIEYSLKQICKKFKLDRIELSLDCVRVIAKYEKKKKNIRIT